MPCQYTGGSPYRLNSLWGWWLGLVVGGLQRLGLVVLSGWWSVAAAKAESGVAQAACSWWPAVIGCPARAQAPVPPATE